MKYPAPAGPKQIILEAASDISAAKRYLPRLSRAAVAHGDKISKDLLNVRPQGSYCYPYKVEMRHDTEEDFPLFSCCHILRASFEDPELDTVSILLTIAIPSLKSDQRYVSGQT